MRLDSGTMWHIYAQLDPDTRRSMRASCKEWASLGSATPFPIRLTAIHRDVSEMRHAFRQALHSQDLPTRMQHLHVLELVLRVPRPRWDADGHDEQGWHWSMWDIAKDTRELCPEIRCVSFSKPGFWISDAFGFAAIYAPGRWGIDLQRNDKTVLFRSILRDHEMNVE